MDLSELKKDLKAKVDPIRARHAQRFFKTGKGEYGEGDIFIGLTMPEIRVVAKKHKHLEINDIEELLHSKIHEERMTALIIMTLQYPKNKDVIYNSYIHNTKWINNWDLVDVTCHKIVGDYLLDKSRNVLYEFANSNNLWKKRVSIISTFAFIDKNDFDDSLKICDILVSDQHDLIHKAVGWVLREIGKKDLESEKVFLKRHYKTMPRTMLRYAIEKFPEDKRQSYLKGDI